ncbi:ABC transporter permease [Streptosporangium subroseum]|uniref:ABC transporter permease n=1 Tax=Streptosporangium subroseum TaxID=106412 RepID=UPI00308611B0|nr:ABC transporter permease [Streptosporangium subroseum]
MTGPTSVAVAPVTGAANRGFTRILLSEWTKLRTVRSTMWALITTIVLMIGAAAAIGMAALGADENPAHPSFNVIELSFQGAVLAQLSLATLGTLVITGEYRTGMIRTSLAAVPWRVRLLLAKALVFGGVAFVISMISAFGAFFVTQAILSARYDAATLADPHAFRVVFGAGLYLVATGLLGLGVGTLIRHSAGAITATVAILFVLPPMLGILPSSWSRTVTTYFPPNAGSQIAVVMPEPGMLSPWNGFSVYCLWIAAVFLAATYLLRHRDA